MNIEFLIIGGILLMIGYLIGVKKMTGLLTGFKEKSVSDKNKLSLLAGGFIGIMGVLFLAAGIVLEQRVNGLFGILVIGYFALMTYVNVRMVAKN
jgi:hypothetical protein